MITAVDTNILLDYLNSAEVHNEQSTQRLLEAGQEDGFVISQTVYAELAPVFESFEDLNQFLETAGIDVSPSSERGQFTAGKAFLGYIRRRPALQCTEYGATETASCERCGTQIRIRQHIVSDFLIGAHALMHADRLLTRDRSYYRTYFPDLTLA